MRTTTTDPMTLNDVRNLDDAPYVIEGTGENAILIYFESEKNRDDYLDMEMHGATNTAGLNSIFAAIADNPNTGSIN